MEAWSLQIASRRLVRSLKFLAEVDDAGANDRTKGCLAGMREA